MKQIHIFSIFTTAESFFDGQFKYLTEQGYEIIVVSSDSPNAEAFCKRNNVCFVPMNIPRSVSPQAIAKAVSCLCHLIRAEKANAVFGHTPVGALCAMMAAKICNVKNRIYYRHGVIYTTMHGLKRAVFKVEEQFVASLATAVINVSHSLSKLAIADKLNNSSKQYVIGHGTCGGIDAQGIFNPSLINSTQIIQLKTQLEINKADIVFGFCGRICNDKGISELVDAFELFQKRHTDLEAKLLLVGHFDSRDSISKLKKQQIKYNKDILISGHVDKTDIPCYYSLLDVFVFPSHREGFGMCAIEASAMEKPLLVSKVHGCEDTIIEDLTGKYIDLDAESICQGMELMLDAERRHFLGKNGRMKVLELYDFRVMWPLVKELYANILK